MQGIGKMRRSARRSSNIGIDGLHDGIDEAKEHGGWVLKAICG
jgi:hypothetical protein